MAVCTGVDRLIDTVMDTATSVAPTSAGTPRIPWRWPRITAKVLLASGCCSGAAYILCAQSILLCIVALAAAVIVTVIVVALTLIITALFGSQTMSERAWRLLRWIANRPEPTPVSTGNQAGLTGCNSSTRPPVDEPQHASCRGNDRNPTRLYTPPGTRS
jgi:hypothetical protein